MTITAEYNAKIFDVGDMSSAKNIILTPIPQQSTEDRWQTETPYLTKLIGQQVSLNSNSAVLDFGCGIGRMSKALIEQHDCMVIGTDISRNMRALSEIYVNNDNFFAIPPKAQSAFKGKFDLVIAIWVLQHVLDLPREIQRIKWLLRDGGKLFVINERNRFVPTNQGWVDDKKDIFVALQSQFKTEEINIMDSEIVTSDVSKRTFWGLFSKE